MPGTRLLRIARAWFDEATVARVFVPLVADWQHECAHATGARRWSARIRGGLAFAMTFAATLATQFWRPLPMSVSLTTWMLAELFIGVGVIAAYGSWILATELRPLTYLLASWLTLAVPFAILPVTIIVLTRVTFAPADTRIAVVRAAVLSVVAMVPLAGWVTPAANQSYRKEIVRIQEYTYVAPGALSRGVRELTLPELVATRPPRDLRSPGISRGRELQGRLSLIALPITLTVLGFALARWRRRAIMRAAAWWVAAAGIVLVVGRAADAAAGSLEIAVGFWPAHLVLLAIALFAARRPPAPAQSAHHV
jgi:hypothetical protein